MLWICVSFSVGAVKRGTSKIACDPLAAFFGNFELGLLVRFKNTTLFRGYPCSGGFVSATDQTVSIQLLVCGCPFRLSCLTVRFHRIESLKKNHTATITDKSSSYLRISA